MWKVLGVGSKKNLHNYLKRFLIYSSLFLLYVWVRLDFLHILQPKHHSRLNAEQIGASSCLSPDIKDTGKMENNAIFYYFFLIE